MRDDIAMKHLHLRLFALVLAAVVVPSVTGCITARQVQRTSGKVMDNLEKIRVQAFVCAPVEYAHTTAHAHFARTESRHGDTIKAKRHLTESVRWYDLTYKKSHNADGTFREGCEEDDDDDSILNSKDQCPREAEDYDGWLDEDGCPDLDNDLDGVLDHLDKCPNQPGPASNDGCPEPDRDGDGVPDSRDKCPDVAGPVSNHGCPVVQVPIEIKEPAVVYKTIVIKEDKIELKQKVFFAFNKDTIMSESFEMLREVAQAMKDYPKLKVRIEGHTDSKGKPAYNKKLSDRRAKSVRTFLIKEGVDPSRMVAIGYGMDRPIDDNDTEDGRDRNRRVEFFIIEK
jgi:outer membrane protein OmpA-like peptidoglycan-associated protein